jgi:hypothetical protein
MFNLKLATNTYPSKVVYMPMVPPALCKTRSGMGQAPMKCSKNIRDTGITTRCCGDAAAAAFTSLAPPVGGGLDAGGCPSESA